MSTHVHRVLIGPCAYLSGCTIGGAVIRRRAEVRVKGTVHLRSTIPEDGLVPISWVAVGDPARVLPPDRHDEIWRIQEKLDFPGEVFGVERSPEMMVEIMDRYTRGLSRFDDDKLTDE